MNQKQQEILNFIKERSYSYPPTVREICAAVGLSISSTVHYHLKRMEAEGYIERKANCPRCISIVK